MINKICLASAVVALASTAAVAADLPARTAPPVFIAPPVVGYNWTGMEFGLTTSYAFSDHQTVRTTGNTPFNAAVLGLGYLPAAVGLNKDGFDNVGGGIGYNYQFTPGSGVVIGGMADVDWFDLTKNAISVTGNAPVAGVPGVGVFHQRLSYLGTLNGRIGYAFDRFLVYGTGGFAFGEVDAASSFFGPGGGRLYLGSTSQTRGGYDFGGGVEYAIPKDSILNYLSVEKLLGFDKTLGLDMFDGTLRAEYVHYNLGNSVVNVASTGPAIGSFTSRYHTEGGLVRVGLGYKLGSAAAPVVAKY